MEEQKNFKKYMLVIGGIVLVAGAAVAAKMLYFDKSDTIIDNNDDYVNETDYGLPEATINDLA